MYIIVYQVNYLKWSLVYSHSRELKYLINLSLKIFTQTIGKWRKVLPKNGPISIISSVDKVFGRLVYNQFYSYLNDNSPLSHYQSGFRASYSTVTSLLESTKDWCINIDNGLPNEVIFVI